MKPRMTAEQRKVAHDERQRSYDQNVKDLRTPAIPMTDKELNADLVAALRGILWIKDCGVDGRDEHGVFRNFPETERDAMYEVAQAALAKART